MEDSKKVIFRIADEEFGIDISNVKGIERQINIVGVPNRPAHIMGIINLRGDVIPVYSMKAKFGQRESRQGESRFIIINANGLTLALKVDDVNEITEISSDNIFDLPPVVVSEDTNYIKNVARIDKRLILMINPAKLLSDEEYECINEMLEEHELQEA